MDSSEIIQPVNLTALSGLDKGTDLSVSRSQQDQEKLIDVAKKFEGILLHEMFKQVKEGLEAMKDQNDEDESSDSCDEQYQSLYWSQLADAVSEKGGIGLYKSFYTQMEQQVSQIENSNDSLNEGV